MYFAAMVLRGAWLLLFLALGPFLTNAQVDVRAEQRAMLLGDARNVIERLERVLQATNISVDILQQARIMETLGEQYHRLSDIDEARYWWKAAFELRAAHYGDASAEAGVGYTYLARYHNYMSAARHEHQSMAHQAASRAIERISPASPNVSGHEAMLAHREFVYAFKVMNGPTGNRTDVDLTSTRGLYRQALDLAKELKDTIWMAQIHHDLGNTYTDLAGGIQGDPNESRNEVTQAQHHYRRSLALLDAIGLVPSEASMMEHFTMGLLFRYAYGTDSLKAAINELDTALIHLARTDVSDRSTDPLYFSKGQLNRAQAVELMSYRGRYFHQLYTDTGDTTLLQEAIRTSDAALLYWEAMLREYRSEAFYKVVGSYDHFLFRDRSVWLAERYGLTNDPKDARASLLASERHKNTMAYRQRLSKGTAPTAFDTSLTASHGPRTRPGTLVISYHFGSKFLAHVISHEGLEVIELPAIPDGLWRGYGILNKFNVQALDQGPSAYVERAYPFYQALLAPVLNGSTEKDLVIIADNHYAHLPFEALPTTPTGDQWSSVVFLGASYTVRYATTLEQAMGTTLSMRREEAVAAAVHHDTLSALPFAGLLVRNIGQWFHSALVKEHLNAVELDTFFPGTGLLHIATHAHAPDLPDALPYLMLSDGPFTTERLNAIKVGRQLVVLNTCSSGDGQVYLGSGVISMGNAFLESGAGAVVHSLWPVDDRATSEIIALMYAGLDEGLPLAEALQQAKLRFIQAHQDDGLAHPFYWAGIIHAGHEVVLAPTRRTVHWGYLTGGLCVVLGMLLYRRSRRRSARSATSGSLE